MHRDELPNVPSTSTGPSSQENIEWNGQGDVKDPVYYHEMMPIPVRGGSTMYPPPHPSTFQSSPQSVVPKTEGVSTDRSPLPPLSSVTIPPADPTFQINRWQNRNFDSGVQTMVHSQTQSLMSLHPSEISVMSGMTDDVTRHDLSDAQRCRFERLSICPSRGDFDASGLAELVQLMRDDDEAVAYKAAYMMQNTAKMDAEGRRERIIVGPYVVDALREVIEKRANSPNIVRVALTALFHLCSHPDGLRDVVELVGNEPTLLDLLITHMRTAAFSSYKYAILSLHSILSDRSALGSAATAEARKAGALLPAMEALRTDQSEKLLPIIVDLVRILCEKSSEQKTLFIERGGLNRLLEIIARCNYENLLWRTTKLLVQLANFNPGALVAANTASVLEPRLAHGSERLVETTLECLRNISDIHPPQGHDVTAVLAAILRLFGNASPRINLYCVQILANMVANKKPYKEFLANRHGVQYLMRVLEQFAYWRGNTEKDAELAEELQEWVLICLRHLCVNNDCAIPVSAHLMDQRHSSLLLDRLVNMRPALLKPTLLILVQAAKLDCTLPQFQKTLKENITFIHQIVIILRVSCHQVMQLQPGMPAKVENVKLSDLISSCLQVLTELARHKHLQDEMVYHLLQPINMWLGNQEVFLPLFVLEQGWVREDSLITSSLDLLSALCLDSTVARILFNYPGLYHTLQSHRGHQDQNIAGPASQLLASVFAHPTHPPPVQHLPQQMQQVQYQQGHAAYPQYPNYPQQPSSVAPPLPPHQYPLNHQQQRSQQHQQPSISRPEPSPEVPQQQTGSWPEDLPLDGCDPFAQVFCAAPTTPESPSDFDTYAREQPQQHHPPYQGPYPPYQ